MKPGDVDSPLASFYFALIPDIGHYLVIVLVITGIFVSNLMKVKIE